jgi:hypothetical protein
VEQWGGWRSLPLARDDQCVHSADSARALRDRLEALQVELHALEEQQRATRVRLDQARAQAAAAIKRERDASLHKVPREGMPWKHLAQGVLHWCIITALVIAAFGAVLGTVTFAIHRYTESVTRWERLDE